MISICYFTKQTAFSCHEKILAFHDFLVTYRQTPRSKILRRHLPSMEAVVEEQSQYEQSAISMSDPSFSSSSLNPDSNSMMVSKRVTQS
jgi:hypothetical protein